MQHPFFRGINWQTVRMEAPPFVPEVKSQVDTQNFDERHMVFPIQEDTVDDEDILLDRRRSNTGEGANLYDPAAAEARNGMDIGRSLSAGFSLDDEEYSFSMHSSGGSGLPSVLSPTTRSFAGFSFTNTYSLAQVNSDLAHGLTATLPEH
jgi:hypothetical protein